jgi:hypothetical protein
LDGLSVLEAWTGARIDRIKLSLVSQFDRSSSRLSGIDWILFKMAGNPDSVRWQELSCILRIILIV